MNPFAELARFRSAQRGIPFVQQLHSTDCGAACLAMVLRYHGRRTTIEALRGHLGASRNGISAKILLKAAFAFGLRGRGLRLEPEDLPSLRRASILHWQFDHFVVYDRTNAKGVVVLDPATGRRTIPHEEFARGFTGIGLELSPTSAFVKGQETRSRVWRYLRKVLDRRGVLFRVFGLTLITQTIALALPVLTGLLVDRVIPEQDVSLLGTVLTGVVVITLLTLLSSAVRSLLLLHMRTELDVQLSLDFLDHLVRLPYSFFQLRQTGDLMMRLRSNSVIREALTSSSLSVVIDGIAVTGYALMLLLVHARIGALVIVLGLLRMAVYVLSRRRIESLASESLAAEAESSSYQVQILEGIESLKLGCAEQGAIEAWTNRYVDVLNVSIRTGRLQALLDGLMSAIQGASPLLILGYGGFLVIQGELTLGTMLTLSALAAGFLGPLSSLTGVAMRLSTLGSYLERVDEVFEQKTEEAEWTGAAAPNLSGRVVLEGIEFRYDPDSEGTLFDINLDVRPGQKVAIVGPTGSGKSSLARLLAGLYSPSEGTIRFDGHDLSTLERRSVRRQIGFVPQSPYLFHDSILRNIALQDEECPRDDVRAAARIAEIDETIQGMPLQYGTRLTAGKGSLSGGEAQRIAIARAVLRNPRILVLDEATSSLDAITESRIHENLNRLACTQIIIAHRLSTIRDADRIVVLEAGRIVEMGTHDSLMCRDGIYAQLVESQLGTSQNT